MYIKSPTYKSASHKKHYSHTQKHALELQDSDDLTEEKTKDVRLNGVSNIHRSIFPGEQSNNNDDDKNVSDLDGHP